MEPSAYAEFRDLEDHHWWFVGRKAIFFSLLRHVLGSGPSPRRVALDLGCGMGGMLAELGDLFEVAIGSDIEPEAVAYCRQRGFPKVFQATGEALPFADDSVDLVTAFDTIEHIEEDEATLAECQRILAPGGRMMISVPAYQFLYTHQDRVVHHHRRYTRRRLRRKLEAAGLEPEKLTYFNLFLFPAILPVVLAIKLKEALRPPPEGDTRTNVTWALPAWVNRSLATIFRSEGPILTRVSAPLGHSLIAIARKPEKRDGPA